ncbi:MAG: twin-arginine translocase subunit TatC [Bacteroidales bacterium]|nr:twin-arginine translocase subunit TatC [Bacteroidales bacterium]
MASGRQRKNNDEEKEMSFLEHLEELRWHILRSIIAIIIFTVLAFIEKDFIFNTIILAPKNPEFFTNRTFCNLGNSLFHSDILCLNRKPFELISIKMSGQLTTHITISIVTGLIIALPYVIWEFWKFFRPALYANERKYTRGAVFWISFLFFLGVIFGYYMIVPLSIHFLGSYSISEQVVNQIYIRSYIGTISSIVLATGITFELPLLAFVLTQIGIITPQFMTKYRRHAIVIIIILAAIITPPDVFSQILVCIPLLLLYEISILVSKTVYRRKQIEHETFMKDEKETIDKVVVS